MGEHRYADGTVYCGDWHRGQRQGFGMLIATDGASYEGECRNVLKHLQTGMPYFFADAMSARWTTGYSSAAMDAVRRKSFAFSANVVRIPYSFISSH